MGARPWTTEQRAEQAAKIGRWKPWNSSTGARTPAGTAVSSQNVLVGAVKRRAAIAQAVEEVKAAQAKLDKLTGRGRW